VRTERYRVLVPMVPQVLVQVVHTSQEETLPSTEQHNLLRGVMTERVMVSVPIVPQFLEQALKPDQPERPWRREGR
jgi:hypothetical protein